MGVLRTREAKGAITSAGVPVLAYVYLGLLAGMVFPLMRWGGNVFVLVYVLLIIKACDIGAFFTGTAIGKHKLIPWLSKGKTWEGLLGGIALAALAGWGGAAWIGPHTDVHAIPVTPVRGAVLGAVLAVVGQGADLFESALKRDGGAKDSGKSIPGFGGMLDVIDSPLLALPVAFWLLRALS
jgi:phosphatidate cytidylyltransferase